MRMSSYCMNQYMGRRYLLLRDVSTGATGATRVKPKFSDALLNPILTREPYSANLHRRGHTKNFLVDTSLLFVSYTELLSILKVRKSRNVFFLAEDSSTKRRKTRRILVKTNSFVRFLEESSAWQFAFEIKWHLADRNISKLETIVDSKCILQLWQFFYRC